MPFVMNEILQWVFIIFNIEGIYLMNNAVLQENKTNAMNYIKWQVHSFASVFGTLAVFDMTSQFTR